MPVDEKTNIAVLIDAENVDPSFAGQIFTYARSLGLLTVREIYGSGIALNEWAEPILENTIHTNFTLRPNRFKNSSDIALVIGAMELLRAGDRNPEKAVAAVVIVSSDSDFSPLAVHLRASGLDVIGMGEPGRINPMWPKACTEFIVLESSGPLMRKRPAETPSPAAAEAPDAGAQPPAPKEESAAFPAEDKSAVTAEGREGEKPAVRIAPTHRERVEIIRAFIAEQIGAGGGRVKSGLLFRALSALPDYSFDQQRSRRNPLDYLERQFGEWFLFEPGGKGTYWVMQKSAAQPGEDTPAAEEPIEETTEETPVEEISGEQRAALTAAGIPAEDTARVAAALSQSENLFAAYNALCQAFGRKQGRQYYDLIKAHFDPDRAAPDGPEEPEDAPEEPKDVPEEPKEEAPPLPEPALTEQDRFLISQGVPSEDAARVSSIVSGSPNLRVAYNELRKAFGNMGRQYLAYVKAYREREQA